MSGAAALCALCVTVCMISCISECLCVDVQIACRCSAMSAASRLAQRMKQWPSFETREGEKIMTEGGERRKMENDGERGNRYLELTR